MSGEIFVGRTKELETVAGDILNRASEDTDPALIYIHAKEGMGKSTFIGSLWDLLAEVGENCIWINPSRLSEVENIKDIPELFVQSMGANKPNLKNRLTLFAKAFGTAVFEFQKNADKDSVDLISIWVDLFKKQFFAQGGQAANTTVKPQVVFVVEDFHKISPKVLEWFKNQFLGQLSDANLLKNIHFVATSSRAFSEDKKCAPFWKKFDDHKKEIELVPLSTDEIVDLLMKTGNPEMSASAILVKTGGMPGLVLREIKEFETQPMPTSVKTQMEGLFRGKTNKQAEWLNWAAHSVVISEESFSVYCNKDEAKKAIAWLDKELTLRNGLSGEFLISSDLAKAMLRWQKSLDKEAFLALLVKAQAFTELYRLNSHCDSRNILCELSCFNYFNNDALENVLGDSASKCLRFIDSQTSLFEKSNLNFQLKSNTRNIVMAYRNILLDDVYIHIQRKVDDFWNAKKANSLKMTSGYEKDVKKGQTKLQSIKTEIESLIVTIEKQKDRISDNLLIGFKDETEKIDPKYKKKRPTYLLTILGVLFVFFSLVHAGPFSLFNAVVGAIMIMMGVLLPNKIRSPKYLSKEEFVKTPAQIKTEEKYIDEDSNIRLLCFKRKNLETSLDYITGTIRKLIVQIEEQEAFLNEPYAFQE